MSQPNGSAETERWLTLMQSGTSSDEFRASVAYALQCVRFVTAINEGKVQISRANTDLPQYRFVATTDNGGSHLAPDALAAFRLAQGASGE